MDWHILRESLRGIKFESPKGLVYTLTGDAHLRAERDGSTVSAWLADFEDGSLKELKEV